MLMKTPFLTDHTSNMLLDSNKNNESSELNQNKLKRIGSNMNVPNNSGLLGTRNDPLTKKRQNLNNSRVGSGRHENISNIIGTSLGPDAHVKPKVGKASIPSSAK